MLNDAKIQGRFTKNPELRTTQNGVSVAVFTIACERNFTNSEGKRDVDFISCIAWRSTAEFIARYFAKGDMVIVEGPVQIRQYTDKNGNRRSETDIVVNSAYFCGEKRKQSEPTAGEIVDLDDDDDLPF